MRRFFVIPLMAAGIISGTGCKQNSVQKESVVPGINLENLDTSIEPGSDFYEYACGGWIQKHPLTPKYARYGTFDQLRENNQEQLRSLIEEIIDSTSEQEEIEKKIHTLYALGLDSIKLNADGFNPVKDQLASINHIVTKGDLTRKVAALHKEGITPLFAIFVDADEKNSLINLVQLQQSGKGMGDRDYYLLEDEHTKKIQDAYKVFIHQLFTLVGSSPEQADAAVDGVMKIETGLAEISFSREELRDSQKNYNKVPLGEFKAQSDFLDWDIYFEELGLSDIEEINPRQYVYYEGLHHVLKNTTLEEQKFYLSFHLLRAAAPYLSDSFVDAHFDFYGKTMSGKEELQPRWKRSLETVNESLSEAVGQLYVDRYFPASSKEKMITLVNNLQEALSERINGLEWMNGETKAKAQEKLTTFIVKIGYPDKWRDYSGLQIKNDSYWANVRRSNIFEMNYMLSEASKPVDRSRWYMSPQTVNAYYNPTTNEICFPAAILQPPFFNPEADDAVNYGAIGVVIGHEMTHGFDDQGRHYDKDGNLSDWWTEEDAAKFKAKADILVEQYNHIIVYDTVHANGVFTLGENIADQGGLLVAYQAYQNSLKGKERPANIDGFTDNQRFYLGYATLWGQNIRPEEILRLTKTDPHSLGKWRVNAALRNIDTFYEAFDIQPGEPMWMDPSERVAIW
ncbi:MAG: M13 family metallopeptidase [Tannerellaceae bacterium]|nr:M13 family metallopeptidase [Tannerellaceae bacterium]